MTGEDRLALALSVYPAVLRRAAYLMLNRADAEDLTQDTYVRLLAMLPRLDERADTNRGMLAVLYRIADHLAIDRRRRAHLQIVPLMDTHRTMHSTSDPLTDAVDAIDCMQRLRALDDEQRLAAACVYVLGMSQSDLASVSGMSLGTIKRRCVEAKRAISAAWGPR